MQNIRSESIQKLFKAITAIDNEETCGNFFEDLCTIKELQDMAQRWETAILLREGKSYQQIAEAVGTSTATISRVNRCLEYGTGGYQTVLNLTEKNNDA